MKAFDMGRQVCQFWFPRIMPKLFKAGMFGAAVPDYRKTHTYSYIMNGGALGYHVGTVTSTQV